MVWDSSFKNPWGDLMNKLSARFVETNKKPGLSNDGLGLYLKTQKTGAKSWIFRYASPVTHRKRDMGLGTLSCGFARSGSSGDPETASATQSGS